MSPSGAPTEAQGRLFASTRWSLVLGAGASSAAERQSAMSDLCRLYWPAIYAYLRRRGYRVEDAQDLTQTFFQHLLEGDMMRRASRERGRFRSFLLGALKLCLADEQARRQALKRGGAVQFISTSELEAEEIYYRRTTSELSPDESLDARWARLLVDRALTRVRGEFVAKGRSETFEILSPFLGGERETSYEQAAREAGVTLSAVKTMIHRLRREFAAAVRSEIMKTVSAPHEVEDELRQLRMVFGGVAKRSADG